MWSIFTSSISKLLEVKGSQKNQKQKNKRNHSTVHISPAEDMFYFKEVTVTLPFSKKKKLKMLSA